jgi:Na+/H+ antiporter NhaD/arsenite permease-like protein
MEHGISIVNPWMILPFALLLLAIATMPFINGGWWEKNYKYVALLLGIIPAVYYIVALDNLERVLASLHEYVSFIALVGSLFVVAGGIHMTIRGRSTPGENLLFLGGGALLANILGTTGASMLLIRPYLRNNKYRLSGFHVVFFIFIVSNIGGALTPVGDPPLFLGYIKGIPFFWITEHALLPWLMTLALLMGVFYLFDYRSFHKMPEKLRQQVLHENDSTKFTGLHNIVFLGVIIGSVFIERPVFLRELLMAGAAVGSWFTTKREIHKQNHFTYHPIQEVAWLFLGIFLAMIPALDWLSVNARSLGISSPSGFYWSTGALSGVLDNAPTYLNFLAAAMGLAGKSIENAGDVHAFLESGTQHVIAISIAAVFFGAMTYIGNGPNFMVKSLAERSGAHVPSFFGYITRYSLPILLPLFILVWLIFFNS